jgi:uncharacterized protein (TIGR00251 family)
LTRASEVHSLPAPTHPALASILRQAASGVTVAVRAQPGAKKTVIAGIYGDIPAAQLKIAVHAQPLEGRANTALIAFLAETFALPKSSITLLTGELSRSKVFLLHGVSLNKAESIISNHLSIS